MHSKELIFPPPFPLLLLTAPIFSTSHSTCNVARPHNRWRFFLSLFLFLSFSHFRMEALLDYAAEWNVSTARRMSKAGHFIAQLPQETVQTIIKIKEEVITAFSR